MKVLAVVCEAYSKNLGDAFIFESISLMLNEMGYRVVCVDLSGRSGFDYKKVDSEKYVSHPVQGTASIKRFFSRSSALRRLVTFLR